MKNSTILSSRVVSLLFLVFLVTCGTLLFQAHIPDYPFDDNNPNIEQPTRESFSHFRHNPNQQPMIVTLNDFDNFDIGIDNYEQYGSSNPLNPTWLFFGANATPQNARGTTNGGLNWYLSNPSYPGNTCCDPWAAHTGSGVLIYASGVTGQYVYRSTNNGINWGPAILSVTGIDRNHVSAEYTGTGPYANYVYAAITGSGSVGPFARSTDAGLTWTTTFSPAHSLPGVYIAVGPNGTTNGGCVMYVTNTGSDATGSRVYNFYRSTNGGANFTLASSQSGWSGFVGTYAGGRHTINNARTAPHPKIAMDNSDGPFRGRLYMVNASNDPPGNGNKPDIWLRYSNDQGTTWSSPVRVNDNANPQQSDQWFPEIWCERTTGKLYIHWYDDRANPSNFTTDIYATYTTDGGQTFAPNQRLTNQSFTFPSPACPTAGCYRGDYTTMMANNPKVGFSVWTDHRNNTAQNMGSYFPDFAMRVRPTGQGLNGINDSVFCSVSVPAVKLYSDTALFSATVTNPPGAGTITLSLLDKTTNTAKDRLTSFPDSLRLRIKTSGGVPNAIYTIRVQGNGPNGTPVHERFITVNVGFLGVTNNNYVPSEFSLYQNYPNPFNPVTNIKFDIPEAGNVSLIIFDAAGREVTTLANGFMQAGSYNYDFNASGLASGVYFYRVTSGSYTNIKKMILVK